MNFKNLQIKIKIYQKKYLASIFLTNKNNKLQRKFTIFEKPNNSKHNNNTVESVDDVEKTSNNRVIFEIGINREYLGCFF